MNETIKPNQSETICDHEWNDGEITDIEINPRHLTLNLAEGTEYLDLCIDDAIAIASHFGFDIGKPEGTETVHISTGGAFGEFGNDDPIKVKEYLNGELVEMGDMPVSEMIANRDKYLKEGDE